MDEEELRRQEFKGAAVVLGAFGGGEGDDGEGFGGRGGFWLGGRLVDGVGDAGGGEGVRKEKGRFWSRTKGKNERRGALFWVVRNVFGCISPAVMRPARLEMGDQGALGDSLIKVDLLQSCQSPHPDVLDQNSHPFSFSIEAHAFPSIGFFHILLRPLLLHTIDQNVCQFPSRANSTRPCCPQQRCHFVHQSV